MSLTRRALLGTAATAGLYALIGCSNQEKNIPVATKEFKMGPDVGKPAPEFPVGTKTIDGQPISLSQHKGSVVLLDFWASWCKPCLEERKYIQNVSGYYVPNGKDFQIVGVGLDSDPKLFEKYVRIYTMRRTQVCDGRGWESPIAKSYIIDALPALILIDKKGIVRESYVQPESLIEKINVLLAEK